MFSLKLMSYSCGSCHTILGASPKTGWRPDCIRDKEMENYLECEFVQCNIIPDNTDLLLFAKYDLEESSKLNYAGLKVLKQECSVSSHNLH